jgi:hypothetical protein
MENTCCQRGGYLYLATGYSPAGQPTGSKAGPLRSGEDSESSPEGQRLCMCVCACTMLISVRQMENKVGHTH